jgi:hypothetical protein
MSKDRVDVEKIESWIDGLIDRNFFFAMQLSAGARRRLARRQKQLLWILLGLKASYRLRFCPGPAEN